LKRTNRLQSCSLLKDMGTHLKSLHNRFYGPLPDLMGRDKHLNCQTTAIGKKTIPCRI
jgi:hypothetical protein